MIFTWLSWFSNIYRSKKSCDTVPPFKMNRRSLYHWAIPLIKLLAGNGWPLRGVESCDTVPFKFIGGVSTTGLFHLSNGWRGMVGHWEESIGRRRHQVRHFRLVTSVARSWCGLSNNWTKIYRYLAKTHRYSNLYKIPLLFAIFGLFV
jgi:hypothetical protein